MLYALSRKGKRTNAYMADEKEEYICPVCHQSVILKRGLINAAHFAHLAGICGDRWNYDMSDWHKRMQGCFPADSQEVVVEYNGEIHRADVLINDIVIEFQHSTIGALEFEERTTFFKNAGFRLAWVFDLSSVSEVNLYPSEDKRGLMIWKNPMRIFANMGNLKGKEFALWFSFGGDEDTGEEYLERVVWAISEQGQYSLKRFICSSIPIVVDGKTPINPNDFFLSPREKIAEELLELSKRTKYSIKYKGKKGEKRYNYICPRHTEKFGIELWGESGCCYCKYCYLVTKSNNNGETFYTSYCCFPTPVRECDGGHPGYECSSLNVFDI